MVMNILIIQNLTLNSYANYKLCPLTLLFADMRFFLSFILVLPLSFTYANDAVKTDIESKENGNKTHHSYEECTVAKNGDANLIDNVHGYVNEKLCAPAIWFDNFFSTDRIDEEIRPGSSLRWQNDFTEDEFGVSTYTTRFRGSFKLPKASKNLRLVFEGDPEDSVEDIVPSNKEDTESQVGFLYEITRSPRAKLSWRLSLSPSLTMRYRYSLPLTDLLTTRFTQQLFYKDSSFGASATIDFIHTFSEDLILRQANDLGRTENDDASKWSVGMVLFQRLNEKSALSYESSYSGTTEPEVFATNARIGVRYRRQIYRHWLFFEVAPEVTWPREQFTDRRQKTDAIFFRLEVNFINL